MNNHSMYLNMPLGDLKAMMGQLHRSYLAAAPYPHICMDHVFNPMLLAGIAAGFPELGNANGQQFKNPNELKLASKGEELFSPELKGFLGFLNSPVFLELLTILTGIEGLVPDPYFWGGGLHEIRKGGFLKIHADFNKHPKLNLDRRINLLIYLNDNWEESYGGHFELWDTKMEHCVEKILPVMNRMVVFNTTDYAYHGHPEPLTCPDNRSRRSIALYYYTNGRPAKEVKSVNRVTTQFRSRPVLDSDKMRVYNGLVNLVTDLTPSVFLKWYKKMNG